MPSTVHFMTFRSKPKLNLLKKLKKLLNRAGLAKQIVNKRDLVAVKLHFGEMGNTAFIRPVYLREIVAAIKQKGGNPFLTDANTLYAGTRGNSVDHLRTATQNGFSYSTVDAPLVIADGLRGKNQVPVTINRKRFSEVFVASEIYHSDALVSVAHFKGHELAGFGGAIKNIGMGCASRSGKLAQHSTVSPTVNEKKCIACGECVAHCSQNALALSGKTATIQPEKCIGCGECLLMCQQKAIQVQWNQAIPVFMENLVEYMEGVLQNKKGKTLCVNFITDVSPACDCMPHNDAPIVRNIGIAASLDPVALDHACADMVNREAALPGTLLTENLLPGQDKFKAIYPDVDWEYQLAYAESLGIGSRKYELVKL